MEEAGKAGCRQRRYLRDACMPEPEVDAFELKCAKPWPTGNSSISAVNINGQANTTKPRQAYEMKDDFFAQTLD